MDHSFGYNAASGPGDFLERRELLWLLVDIAAKGGNLLLNVGPRGVDGALPDEQVDRLDWLGRWAVPNRRALMDTRPWVRPGSTTADGVPVRYTARGDTVFALVGTTSGTVALDEVLATPTTAVTTVDGIPLVWAHSPSGLSVELPAGAVDGEPTVVVLERVEARPG
jgi:alpha-L-fucosidase